MPGLGKVSQGGFGVRTSDNHNATSVVGIVEHENLYQNQGHSPGRYNTEGNCGPGLETPLLDADDFPRVDNDAQFSSFHEYGGTGRVGVRQHSRGLHAANGRQAYLLPFQVA